MDRIDWDAWEMSPIPDGPNITVAERVLHGLRRCTEESSRWAFYDACGQSVEVPLDDSGKIVRNLIPLGYAEALWDLRSGSMFLGDDGRTLYVRDVDESGANRRMESFHAIASLEDEYHVKGNDVHTPWNRQLIIECGKLSRRVRHGVKFRDRAIYRTADGVLHVYHTGDDLFGDPFELYVDTPWDDELVRRAVEFARFVTSDEHSAKNLIRMFAAPLLEPCETLSELWEKYFYVLFGEGSNGNGILLNALRTSFPWLAAEVNIRKLLSGRRVTFRELAGKLWVFDEDVMRISVRQAAMLNNLLTWNELVAHRIGGYYVTFRPRATFVIVTNENAVLSNTAALNRRRICVHMRGGRDESEFADLLAFRAQYGAAPFVMASCDLWLREGTRPYSDVVLGDPRTLSDAEAGIVRQIVRTGYAIISDVRPTLKKDESTAARAKLGLKRATRKVLPMGADEKKYCAVFVVDDEEKFSVYRSAMEAE